MVQTNTIELQRKLNQLCWDFEEAQQNGEQPTIEEWLDRCNADERDTLRSELEVIMAELDVRPSHPRYDFIVEIARGGSAVVWEVFDKHLQRVSAIKYLLGAHNTQDMRRRLEQEARIGARLHHPGIVPVHELDRFEDGSPFVCMKRVSGKTLSELLASHERASIDSLLVTFLRICEVMAYAHQSGIIHRDLKPANIMVGEFGEVQIMDWGLARIDSLPSSRELFATTQSQTIADGDPHATVVGSIFGTPSYMAPEQAQGRVQYINARSDVFSLGCILCKIITGRAVYEGESQTEVLEQAKAANTTNAIDRLRNSRAPSKWKQLAIKCLSAEPSNRPNDGAILVDLIRRINRPNRVRSMAARVSVVVLLGFAMTVLLEFIAWQFLEAHIIDPSHVAASP
jgi:eukaryotic-like serine/threonine-protein kinase